MPACLQVSLAVKAGLVLVAFGFLQSVVGVSPVVTCLLSSNRSAGNLRISPLLRSSCSLLALACLWCSWPARCWAAMAVKARKQASGTQTGGVDGLSQPRLAATHKAALKHWMPLQMVTGGPAELHHAANAQICHCQVAQTMWQMFGLRGLLGHACHRGTGSSGQDCAMHSYCPRMYA